MRNALKRVLALVLVFMMVLSLTPAYALAAEEGEEHDHVQAAETEITVAAESTPEVTAEPTPEVTAEPTPEVTAEPTPEVTAEPTPEVTAEPTPEVTAEPTPEVTAEPTPVATEAPVVTIEATEITGSASGSASTLNAGSLNVSVTGLGATYTDASNSSGKAEWSASGTSITGKATGYKQYYIFNNSITTSLTLTNNLGEEATLKFSYTLTGGGSVSGISGGSYEGTLANGASITITLTSPEGESTNVLTITGLSLVSTSAGDLTTTFKPATEGGSYTVDGAAISADTEKTNAAGAEYALVAAPASNYVFFGWYSETQEAYISYDASYTVTPAEDMTIIPKFVPATAALFGVGSAKFFDLNEADTFAKTNSVRTIVLLNNGTLPSGNYTVSSGNTLLIPFDSANTCYTTEPDNVGTTGFLGDPIDWVEPTAYRTLTMASNASITVEGAISVSAKHSMGRSDGQQYTGSPSGACGFINMASGSEIVLESGSALYAWGYIVGDGTITAKSGSQVWENMQFTDFRGGDATSQMSTTYKAFPMSQYYVQNIEVLTTYYAGAAEYVYTTIYMSKMPWTTSLKFMGEGGMFVPENGYITKDYDEATDRLKLTAHGDSQLNGMSMTISTTTIDSSLFVLPINSNIDITIKSGATTVNQSIAMLPGSTLTVDQGATLKLTKVAIDSTEEGLGVAYKGANLVVIYDADNWNWGLSDDGNNTEVAGYFVHAGLRIRPVSYAPGRTGTRGTGTLTDVVVDINGTVISDGYLYTTSGKDWTGNGASIISSEETGKVVMTNGAGTDTYTYQANYTNGSIVYLRIPMKSAQLKNGDGSYTDTDMAEGGDSFVYDATTNKWEIVCAAHSYGEGVKTDATCTAQGYFTYTCAKCGGSYTNINQDDPAKGHDYNSVVTAPTCTADGYTTHTCSRCNDSYVDSYVDATGHSYGEWSTTRASTCTVKGEERRDCDNCDHYETAEIALIPHSYTSVVTASTCTAQGYTTHTCSVCGNSYKDTYTDKIAHSYEAVVTAPTCTAQGYTTHTCSACGDSYTDSQTDALGHKYTNYVSNDDATCLADGTKTAVCDNGCGTKDTVADAGSATGHSYTKYVSNNDATCEEDGTKTAVCDNGCGEEDTVTDEGSATGHSYTNYVSNNDATCEEDGTKTAVCDNGCGTKDTVADAGSATGHSYTNYVSNGDAICVKDGTKTAECDNGCGTKDTVADAGSATGHIYGEWTVTNDPTCTETGTQIHYCKYYDTCSQYETGVIPATGHSYTKYESDGNATCEEDGTKTAVCDNGCGEEDRITDEDSALGHDKEDHAAQAATCTAIGWDAYVTCSRCDYTTYTEKAALGHDEVAHEAQAVTCTAIGWDAYVTCSRCDYTTYKENAALGHDEVAHEAQAATCTEIGWDAYVTCSRCDYSTYEEKAALGHVYVPVVTDPTCTEAGYTTYTCSRKGCGDSYVADTVAALDHDWSVGYAWTKSGDEWTCTATRACANDANHNVTATATVDSEVNTEPTCTAMGETTYTATFTEEWAEEQTQKLTDIPSKGHKDENADYICDVCQANLCIDHEFEVVVTEPTCEAQGYTTSTCKKCHDVVVDTYTDAIGHGYGTATYVWSEDGKVCTATRVCGNDATHIETATAEITSAVKTPASCTDMGVTTYTATFEADWAETQTKDVTDIPATGHAWGETDYDWSDDGKACTAKRVCATDTSHVETAEAKVTGTQYQAATCTTPGSTKYTAAFTGVTWAVAQETFRTDIPATEHAWSVTYKWSEDGKSCTAAHVCGNDASHNVTATATVGSEVTTAATCISMGVTTYTAAFDVPWAETQTKDVTDIAVLDHNWSETTYEWSEDGEGNKTCTATRVCENGHENNSETAAATVSSKATKAATCTEKGETTYTATFNVSWAAAQTKTVADVAAMGHTWSRTTYAWSEDGSSCTAKRVCIIDSENHIETVEATITSEVVKAATCTEVGDTMYTATFDADWTEAQTKTVVGDIAAIQHAWGETTYAWSDDGKSCTATRICGNDPENHIETATAAIGSEVAKAATCTQSGDTKYTATFVVDWAETQSKTVEGDVAAKGHAWGSASYNWSDDGSTCIATRICGNDAEHIETADAAITGEVKTAATCVSMGVTAYTATFEVEWADTQTKDVTDIAALGHAWGEPVYTWSEDGSTCAAKRDCGNNAEHTMTARGAVSGETAKAATCTEVGDTKYTAVFGVDWAETQTKTVIGDIPALDHAWGTTSYEWSDDGKTCTAKRVCGNDAAHVETAVGAISSQVSTAATCTEAGDTKYTATFEAEWAETRTKTVVGDIPAINHAWGEASYVWSADGKTCTARRVCGNNARHIETAEATITNEVEKAASCTKDGDTKYTATFDTEWTATQTKVITDIPATGHTELPAVEENRVAATCIKDGSYQMVVYCDVCGSELSRVTEVLKALGHSYTSYQSNGDATCEEDGTKTAACDNGCGTEDTIADEGSAMGHDWGEATYLWSTDAGRCTAERVCQTDKKHTEFARATVTSEVEKAATCTEKGSTKYTATFTEDWAEDQTKTLTNLAATGVHNYENAVCTMCGQMQTYTITWELDGGDFMNESLDPLPTTGVYGETVTISGMSYKAYHTLKHFVDWEGNVISDSWAGMELEEFSFVMPAHDVTLTAVWEADTFTIKFVNDDGTVLSEEEVAYGTVPEAPEDPSKEGDIQYAYTFAGWDKDVVAVTGKATYKATYDRAEKEYIIWVGAPEDSWAGYRSIGGAYSVLMALEFTYTEDEFIDMVPGHKLAGFALTPGGEIVYPLTDGEITLDLEEHMSKAELKNGTYQEYLYGVYEPIEYAIGWDIDGDGVVDTITSEKYGEIPEAVEAAKAADENFSYVFAGWDKEITAVTGETTYTALYTKTGWLITEAGRQYIIEDVVQYTGWTEIGDSWYYLDPETGYAAVGAVRLPYPAEAINGVTYAPIAEDIETGHIFGYTDETTALFVFDETTGAFRNDLNGMVEVNGAKHWAVNGQLPWHVGLVEFEGDYYYFVGANKMVIGNVYAYRNTTERELVIGGVYTFDADGKLCEYNGITQVNDVLYYYENAQLMIGHGLVQIDGNYYYVRSNGALVTDASYWVVTVNEYTDIPVGPYEFDENGVMQIGKLEKDGIYQEDGKLYFYQNGYRVYKGLIQYSGTSSEGVVYENAWIYVRSTGEVVCNGRYWVTNVNNSGYAQGYYDFDENGVMLMVKNGIIEENGSLYYYVNGYIAYAAGLIELDGAYYYVRSTGEVVNGGRFWVTNVNDTGYAQGYYEFDENGAMQEPKNGIVNENGTLYYYVDGAIAYAAGLIELDGAYYYVRSNGVVVSNSTYWVTNVNDTGYAQGYYAFDENGKMITE